MPPVIGAAVGALAGAGAGAAGAAAIGATLATTAVVGAAAVGLSAYSSAEKKKAQGKALTFAEEQEVRAREEARRREGIVALTPEEIERERRTFELEKRRLPVLEERAGMTGEELLSAVGPTTRQLLEDIAAEQGLTGEELFRREGAIPQALQEQVLAEVRAPEQFFESTLEQELELVRQQVNAEANRRGVFGGLPEGGIRFEQLGRAGVDLAIKSAQERQAARQQALVNASALATQFANLRAAATGRAAQVGTAGLEEQERARGELAQLLQDIQNLSGQARTRQAQGQELGAQITGAGAERRAGITGAVLGGQIQEAAEGERAGLEFGGELLGAGIEKLGRPTTPREDRLFEERIAALEEEPLERISLRAGRLPPLFSQQ